MIDQLQNESIVYLGDTAHSPYGPKPLADVRAYALDATIEEYELSFEGGERMHGRFLIQRLDYAGDFNGERTYTLQLESSGPVVTV